MSAVRYILKLGGCWLLLAPVLLFAVDVKAALEQAVQLVERGDLAEAEKQARLALPDPVACAVLGGIRLKQANYPASIAFLEKALKMEPRMTGARANLAHARAANEAVGGRYQRSLDFAEPILDELRQTPEGLILLATDYVGLRQLPAAKRLAEWPGFENTSLEWSIKFALILAKGGLPGTAAEILERAKHNQPATYELEFNLAGVRLLEGDLEKAIGHYDAAVQLRPESVAALKQAALVAERRGELERSLSYWVRVKKLQPDDAETLYGFGKVCLKMDLLEDGEPALARAVALKPAEPAFVYALASARIGKKQFEDGETLLSKLLLRRPHDPHLEYALGAVLYLESKLVEAARHLLESVRLEPKQVASYYYLGLVARDQGNNAEAVRRLQELLKGHPEHAPAQEALGILLFNQQNYEDARVHLEKALELNPKSVKSNYQFGLLLARLGEKDAAARRFELAKSLREEDEATSKLQMRLLDPEQVEQ